MEQGCGNIFIGLGDERAGKDPVEKELRAKRTLDLWNQHPNEKWIQRVAGAD